MNRKSLEDGWGFSLIGGVDYLQAAGQFDGIVTRKGETGLWLKVSKDSALKKFKKVSHLRFSRPSSISNVKHKPQHNLFRNISFVERNQ